MSDTSEEKKRVAKQKHAESIAGEAQDQDKEDAEMWALFLELEKQYSRTNRMLAKEEYEETSEQWEADMARDCFLARGKH